MNQFEKILFLELTCFQLGKVNTSQEEYLKTYQNLSEGEKEIHSELYRQIHNICTYINTPFLHKAKNVKVNSIHDYNEIIAPVDKRIINVCDDFGITLNREITPKSEKYNNAIRKYLGL